MSANWTVEDYEAYRKRRMNHKHEQEKTLQKLNLAAENIDNIEKQSKYHNTKATADGIEFDSTKEKNRYCELKMLQMANQIKEFYTQPEFELLEPFRTKDGKKHQGIKYIADFKVIYPDGKIVIEDVKSVATVKDKTYQLKKKMFLSRYGMDYEFKEIL